MPCTLCDWAVGEAGHSVCKHAGVAHESLVQEKWLQSAHGLQGARAEDL